MSNVIENSAVLHEQRVLRNRGIQWFGAGNFYMLHTVTDISTNSDELLHSFMCSLIVSNEGVSRCTVCKLYQSHCHTAIYTVCR